MLEGFAEQCMAEYDVDGWTIPGFFNPDDVPIVGTLDSDAESNEE